jgi:hypothetical protein
MSEHEPHGTGSQRIPPLLRFLGLHLALGAAIGVAVVSVILLSNLAGLKRLIVEAQNPFVPLLLLYTFNIITFSSVTMGIGIMTMPLEKAEEARRPEDEPEADDLHPRLAGARASKTKRRD